LDCGFVHYPTQGLGLVIDPTEKAVEAAAALIPEVYQDLAKGSVKLVGNALERATALAMSPLLLTMWGLEQSIDWVKRRAGELAEARKLNPEKVVSPAPQLLAGVISGVQANGADPDPTLRELYANLLVTAMDGDATEQAHPSFVQILSQLTAEEARLLSAIACQHPSPFAWWIDVAQVIPPVDSRTTIMEADIQPLGVEIRHVHWYSSYVVNLRRLGITRDKMFIVEYKDVYDAHLQEKTDSYMWKLMRAYLERHAGDNFHWATEEFGRLVDHLIVNKVDPTWTPSYGGPEMRIRFVRLTDFGLQLVRALIPPGEVGAAEQLDPVFFARSNNLENWQV
jgi:hypothetical protein